MSRFGMYVKFTAQVGRGGELAGLLLQAAASMEALPDCEMYTINLSDD